MQITREMRIGAGILAFVGVVVWILPPTTPVAPIAGPVRQHAARASTTVSAPAPIPPLPRLADADPAPFADARDTAAPVQPIDPGATRPRWRDAPSDEDAEDGASRPDFETGYRWAQANGIDERRACRRWRGSPAEEGCRAFLNDAEDQDAEDAPEPGLDG